MVVASTGLSKNLVTCVMLCTSMNEVKNAMMSTHCRSFFLCSNSIACPTRTMFVHKIHESPWKGWCSSMVVVFLSWVGIDVYNDPVLSHSMVWIRISHKDRRDGDVFSIECQSLAYSLCTVVVVVVVVVYIPLYVGLHLFSLYFCWPCLVFKWRIKAAGHT